MVNNRLVKVTKVRLLDESLLTIQWALCECSNKGYEFEFHLK